MAGEYVYDTDQATLHDPAGNQIAHASVELPGTPPVRAISVNRLLIGPVARVRAVGSKPLLVASWSEILVQGTIDVSSSAMESGAGASTGACTPAGAGEMGRVDGGGGGGGGGFGGNGGFGGDSPDDINGGAQGRVVAMPSTVRGGCPCAPGGRGKGLDGSGAGGAGGGALQLTARYAITITGRLTAGGSGGQGASGFEGQGSGGGGGGSGGLLDLEAPTITIGPAAIITANGGGGGEGCGLADANSGLSGQNSGSPAQGGSGADSLGGDGGNGSGGSNPGGASGASGSESGFDEGGGGGAGYIITGGNETVAVGAVLSPPPVQR